MEVVNPKGIPFIAGILQASVFVSKIHFSMGFLYAVLSLLFSVTTMAFNISFVQTNEKYCSKTLFHEEQEQCEAVHVKFSHSQITALDQHMRSFDDNPLVRKMYLNVHLRDQSADTTDIDGILDQFLAPRPWWMVLSEEMITHDELSHEFALHIFMIRMTPRLELGLHQLAAVQFPPDAQSCQEIPLCIVRMVERGKLFFIITTCCILCFFV